jgi:hypothetical protein
MDYRRSSIRDYQLVRLVSPLLSKPQFISVAKRPSVALDFVDPIGHALFSRSDTARLQAKEGRCVERPASL